MKRSVILAVIVAMLFLLTLQSNALAQYYTKKMYVKVPEENLRSAPNGKKLGTLMEGTEATVLVEQDKWLKVQFIGWIWKESMTLVKPTAVVQGEFRALHILVKTREEAEEVMQLLRSSQDFKEVAKSKSISPSAAKGGDLGYFNRGDFNPQLENVIMSLQADQLSEVVETDFGFNIFKRVK